MNPLSSLEPIIEVWKNVQINLPEVIRWKKYTEKWGGRKQNSLQHTESIVLLGITVLEKLKSYVKLDNSLLISALAVHDIGEGEIKRDTAYVDKSQAGDLEEYLAFRKRHEPLGP